MQIRVQVKPNSSCGDKVEPQSDGSYLVYLRAKPIDGAANTALIKILSDYFDTPKSRITIKNGDRSRYKTVEIANSPHPA